MKKFLSLVATVGLLSFAGCGGGDGDQATGTCAIQGTVESFEPSASAAAIVMAAVPGIVVYIDGPVLKSTTTDANGVFSFTGLPAGDYSLRFMYNGEEVTYRGQSGQVATVSVADDQTVEISSVKISGGQINIGNIKIVSNGQVVDGDNGTPAVNVTGLWSVTGASDKGSGTFEMNLIRSGNNLSGTVSMKGSIGNLTGNINGNSISLTIPDPDPASAGSVGSFVGAVSGSTMSGSFTSTAGGESPYEAGTWTAIR